MGCLVAVLTVACATPPTVPTESAGLGDAEVTQVSEPSPTPGAPPRPEDRGLANRPQRGPVEQWSGDEIEQEWAALHPDGDTTASTTADARDHDVDGVSHVERVSLSSKRAAVLRRDHLGIDNVYLAGADDGALVVETMVWDPQEFETIADELETIAQRTRSDLPWVRTHSALQTFSPGQSLTVVGPKRRWKARLVEFQAMRDANQGFLRAKFEPMNAVPREALVLRGSAHASARLRVPAPLAPTDAVIDELRRQAAPTGLASRVRPEHVIVADIGFQATDSQIVIVSMVNEDSDDMRTDELSGAFVRQPDGTIHSLVPIRLRHQPVELSYLVDLDGDGIDEIMFRTDNATNGYRYLAVWDGTVYRNLRLVGSGG